MARSLGAIMAELQPANRRTIETAKTTSLEQINTLRAVRELAGKTRGQIAARLGKTQPSIQKLETQANVHISTLRRFVEAAGGSVEIRVNLPGRPPVQLTELESDFGRRSLPKSGIN